MPQKLCLFQIIILTLRYNSKVKPRLTGTQYHQRFYLQHIKISIVARIEASGTLVYPTREGISTFLIGIRRRGIASL